MNQDRQELELQKTLALINSTETEIETAQKEALAAQEQIDNAKQKISNIEKKIATKKEAMTSILEGQDAECKAIIEEEIKQCNSAKQPLENEVPGLIAAKKNLDEKLAELYDKLNLLKQESLELEITKLKNQEAGVIPEEDSYTFNPSFWTEALAHPGMYVLIASSVILGALLLALSLTPLNASIGLILPAMLETILFPVGCAAVGAGVVLAALSITAVSMFPKAPVQNTMYGFNPNASTDTIASTKPLTST
jgi:hypothetical protein